MPTSQEDRGYINRHRRGPLIQGAFKLKYLNESVSFGASVQVLWGLTLCSLVGLSQGPALELEARVAAQRESKASQLFEPVKRRKLHIASEDTANPGVQARDLKDRATLRVSLLAAASNVGHHRIA